ncbi:hypothetical protein SRHO_G00214150 [Serrasalmus rhombeus]
MDTQVRREQQRSFIRGLEQRLSTRLVGEEAFISPGMTYKNSNTNQKQENESRGSEQWMPTEKKSPEHPAHQRFYNRADEVFFAAFVRRGLAQSAREPAVPERNQAQFPPTLLKSLQGEAHCDLLHCTAADSTTTPSTKKRRDESPLKKPLGLHKDSICKLSTVKVVNHRRQQEATAEVVWRV